MVSTIHLPFKHQTIHALDLLQWFLGSTGWIKSSCKMVNHKVEIENLGITLLHFWSGAMGAIEGSNVIYSGFPQKTELHGEEESITLEGDQIAFWKLQDSSSLVSFSSVTKKLNTSPSSTASFPFSIITARFKNLLRLLRKIALS